MPKQAKGRPLIVANDKAWALVSERRGRVYVRRIVWGRALARAEKRDGEKIVRVGIRATAWPA
jgi:hypothetical protein